MTVGDLVRKLSAFDQSALVEIIDADTSWRMPKIYVADGVTAQKECQIFGADPEAGKVYLWVDYADKE